MPPRPEVVSPGEGLESGLDDIAWAEARVRIVEFGGFGGVAGVSGVDWKDPVNRTKLRVSGQ